MRTSEPVIEAGAKDVLLQIGLVGEDVCGECNGRSEGRKIGAGCLYLAKIGKQVFALHRPMVSAPNLELHATACDPASPYLVHAGVFVRGREGVNKQRLVIEIG